MPMRADGERFLHVPKRVPGLSAVDALPDAAAGGAGIDDVRVGRMDRQRLHPAIHVSRAD